MSRPVVAASALLAGVAAGIAAPAARPAPAAAQSAAPIEWSYDLGHFTIFGHTIYSETVLLLPRVVYDTAHGIDSARVVDSVRTGGVVPVGLAAGLNQWPTDRFCAGPVSATMVPLEPAAVLARLQLAARCGLRLVIVPPRRFLTTTGQTAGTFSVDSAKRLVDRYAAVLPPDTLREYGRTIIGLNLGDDYGDKNAWGGKAVTQVQIAAWAAYARTRLPGVPLGVRVTPDWVKSYPALAPLLDYAWAQYHTALGDAGTWYDARARIAQELGLGLVMGVNVEGCDGPAKPLRACTAAELLRYGTIAVAHPASCAFLSWRYADATWAREDIRAAWDTLFAAARRRGGRECRRAV
jgi:hypothetical protein